MTATAPTETNTGTEQPVQAEPTQAQLEFNKAKGIVEPMVKAQKSDEEMIISLIQNGGFAFKKAGRLLKQTLEALGVRMSNKNRLEQASEILLKHKFAPTSWDEVTKAAAHLAEVIDATSEAQALVAIKKFAKVNEITLPDKPRGVGTKTGFRSKCFAWMLENPNASDAEFSAFMKENEQNKVQTSFYLKVYTLARGMAKKLAEAA
jgi:hypothetical protein